jgi:hypothetical protein
MLKLFTDSEEILERLETMQKDTKWWNTGQNMRVGAVVARLLLSNSKDPKM